MTRKRLLALAGFLGSLVLLFGSSASTSAGGNNVPLPSGQAFRAQRDSPVEPWNGLPIPTDYSVWVLNPTGCLWDPDDQDQVVASGYLDPGATSTWQGCLNADPNPIYTTVNGTTAWWSWAIHPWLTYDVFTPTPLRVTVCYQPQNQCWSPNAIPTTASGTCYYTLGMLCYSLEIGGPFYDPGAPEVEPIAGSNGGYGVPTTYTLTITNLGGHRVRGIGVAIRGGNDQGPSDAPILQGADFKFWIGHIS